MTFRALLQPMTAEEFFAHVYSKLATHIPGYPQKFVNIFSWEEFNRLFNQPTLWSERRGARLRTQKCQNSDHIRSRLF